MRFPTAALTRRALFATLAVLGLASTATAAEIASVLGAGGRNTHSVFVGSSDNWLIVDGDGRSDLDCWVYDEDGAFVDSDTDGTDYCILKTPGMGRHRLVVKNLGTRPDRYEIEQRARLQ